MEVITCLNCFKKFGVLEFPSTDGLTDCPYCTRNRLINKISNAITRQRDELDDDDDYDYNARMELWLLDIIINSFSYREASYFREDD